jgi:hypothetical protein
VDHEPVAKWITKKAPSKFCLPRVTCGASSITLDATQLGMLLDGIDVEHVRRARHWTPPAIASDVGHG